MRTNIIRACAIVVVVCFFLPFFTVSCAGETRDISGLDIAVGVEDASDGNPLAFLVLVLATAIFVVTFVFKGKPLKAIAEIAGSILGVALMITIHGGFVREVKSMGLASVNMSVSDVFDVRFGYWGCVLAYSAILVIAVYDTYRERQLYYDKLLHEAINNPAGYRQLLK